MFQFFNKFNLFKKYKKMLCPFCFEYFYLKDTPFRCSSLKNCKQEIDPILKAKWGDSSILGKVIPPIGYFVRKIKCECGQEAINRLCPHCHCQIPDSMLKYKNYIIAIIGAKEAGKSHYLAVLIDQLKKLDTYNSNFNIFIESISNKTINRYNNSFYRPIFKNKHTIPPTMPALADYNVTIPLVYSLHIEHKILNLFPVIDILILVFFDTAGEDLNDSDTMSIVNKYIYRSKGIILLIDPLQLATVRAKLDRSVYLPAENTETSDILTRTTRLIQKGLELDLKRIKIPIALSLTKFDAVKTLIARDSIFYNTPDHTNGFNYYDFIAQNAEIAALLEDWGERYLVSQIKNSYKKYGFFALSALGYNPDSTLAIPYVNSHRVLEPLLWLLANNNLIKKNRKD
jgi:hypothetical protein